MLGCWAIVLPRTEQSVSQLCVALALDIWKYCSGKQSLTAQHPLLNVCPNGLNKRLNNGLNRFPVICHLVARGFT